MELCLQGGAMTISQIFAALNLSSLSEIADLYGVSTRTVRRWLDGSRDPGPIFYRYSAALLSGYRPSPQGER